MHSRPAPAPLLVQVRFGMSDLLALVNTRHGPAGHWHARPRGDGPDHDHLETPATAVAWLVDHHVPVPPGQPGPNDLAALHRVRDAARSIADGETAVLDTELASLLAAAPFRLLPSATLAAEGDGWAAVAADMLPPLLALAAERARVRRCGNPRCRFTFVDHSPARNRQWCDPRGCGNRTRVGRSRGRLRAAVTDGS